MPDLMPPCLGRRCAVIGLIGVDDRAFLADDGFHGTAARGLVAETVFGK